MWKLSRHKRVFFQKMLSSHTCLLYPLAHGLFRLKQIVRWATKKAWDSLLTVQPSYLSLPGEWKSEIILIYDAFHYISLSKVPEKIKNSWSYKGFFYVMSFSKGLACFLEMDLCYILFKYFPLFCHLSHQRKSDKKRGEHSELKKHCIWIGKHTVQADTALVPWKLIFSPPSIFEWVAIIQF